MELRLTKTILHMITRSAQIVFACFHIARIDMNDELLILRANNANNEAIYATGRMIDGGFSDEDVLKVLFSLRKY